MRERRILPIPPASQDRADEIIEYLRKVRGHATSDSNMLTRVPSMFLTVFGLRQFFREMLSQYAMSSADRAVIERAARDLDRHKSTKMWNWSRVKVEATYKKRLADFRKYLEVATRVTSFGRRLSKAEPRRQAGGLELVNAGGFPPEVMQLAEQVVAQAADILKARGLDKLLYGSVRVVNTIRGNTKQVAFYDHSTDGMFVRANVKGQMGPAVNTVIHELAHRLHMRFLDDREVQNFYDDVQERSELKMARAKADPAGLLPAVGTEFEDGGKQWVVRSVVHPHRGSRRDGQIVIRKVEQAQAGPDYAMTFKGWITHKNIAAASDFVTAYAQKNAEENFAETLVAYLMGRLPENDWRAEQIRRIAGIARPEDDSTKDMGAVKIAEGLFRITYKDLPTIYVAEAAAGSKWAVRRTPDPWTDTWPTLGKRAAETREASVAACLHFVKKLFDAGDPKGPPRRPRVGRTISR